MNCINFKHSSILCLSRYHCYASRYVSAYICSIHESLLTLCNINDSFRIKRLFTVTVFHCPWHHAWTFRSAPCTGTSKPAQAHYGPPARCRHTPATFVSCEVSTGASCDRAVRRFKRTDCSRNWAACVSVWPRRLSLEPFPVVQRHRLRWRRCGFLAV